MTKHIIRRNRIIAATPKATHVQSATVSELDWPEGVAGDDDNDGTGDDDNDGTGVENAAMNEEVLRND